MPTREILDSFWQDFDRLTPQEQAQFKAAIRQFVEDLRQGRGFRKGLRVKRVQKAQGVYEMTWADEGRATFEFGAEQRPGEYYIIWRRIGGHEILKHP
ncbi:MAG: hypothetical protein ACXWP6_16155 [Ktedonobacterales bacterium]